MPETYFHFLLRDTHLMQVILAGLVNEGEHQQEEIIEILRDADLSDTDQTIWTQTHEAIMHFTGELLGILEHVERLHLALQPQEGAQEAA